MLARLGIERNDSIPDLNELLNFLFTPEFIIQFLEKINQAHDNAADRIDVPQFEACIRVMWLCHVCRCSSTTLFNFWKSGVNGGCMDKPEGFDKPLWSRFMAGLRHVRNSVDIDDSSWNQGVRFDPELKELGKSKYLPCYRYYIMTQWPITENLRLFVVVLHCHPAADFCYSPSTLYSSSLEDMHQIVLHRKHQDFDR